jgi:hypothetical protein
MLTPVVLSTHHWKLILKELLSSEVALSEKDAREYRAIINLILAHTGLKEDDILREVDEDSAVRYTGPKER